MLSTTLQLKTIVARVEKVVGGVNCVLKEAYYVWCNVLGILFLRMKKL